MNLQITLAARYLGGHKLRTFLTTLAVTIGVVVIFGMNILIPTMMEAFQANIQGAAGAVDLTITQVANEAFPAEVLDTVRGVPGIKAVAPMLSRVVGLPQDFFDNDPATTDRISTVMLTGIDPELAPGIHVFTVGEGRFLEAGDVSAAVITESLADALGLRVGDTIILPTAKGLVELTIVGLLPPRLQPGNEEILVTLADAQTFFGQAGQINIIEASMLNMDENERTAIREQVQAALGDAYSLNALSSGAEIFGALNIAQATFNLFGILALFMGGFIIYNTFRTVVTERRREIGMLRAVGASRRTITGLIIVESLFQGILGTAVGIVGGYVLLAFGIKAIQPILNSFIHLNLGSPKVSPGILVASIILGVGVTVLAGLIPALQANRITPLEALRPSQAEKEFRRGSKIGLIAGLVFLGVAIALLFTGQTALVAPGGLLFLAGLVLVAPALVNPIASLFSRFIEWFYARNGVGELARRSINRQPQRTAITASTTMIGLAIIIGLSGIIGSLSNSMMDIMRRSLGSDYLFVPPSIGIWSSTLGANPDLAQRLRAVEGVKVVSTMRFALSNSDGIAISLLGLDPVDFPQVSALDFQVGDESAYQDLAAGRNMIVNVIFQTQTGTRVGDTVELTTPRGKQAYRIVAVANDFLNVKVTTAYISQANLEADFDRAEDVFLQLNLEPGADVAIVEPRIKTILADYPQFTTISGRKFYQQFEELLKTAFSSLYILLGFLAAPSLIAILNTLAISVIERTREIGMLRAIGATRRQVQRMVVAEGLLLAAIGSALGILAGLYLGYVMLKGLETVFPLTYQFPVGGILVGVAAGLLFGGLAAILPSRQAAHMQVVEALRYE